MPQKSALFKEPPAAVEKSLQKLGANLRAARLRRKLTIAEAAARIGSGVRAVSDAEHGKTTTAISVYFALLWTYGMLTEAEHLADSAKDRGSNVTEKPVIVRDIILESANAHPDMTAYMHRAARGEPYRRVSYLEAMGDIFALGAKLCEMGLKGKRIAVIGDNCYPWAVTYFAVIFGAGIIVPLDKESRPEEIENLLRVAECSAVFYTERYDDVMKNIDFVPYKVRMTVYSGAPAIDGVTSFRELVSAGKVLPASSVEAFKRTEIDENEMAVLLFTSGTTGNAKGVMLSNRHLGTNISDMMQAHGVKPGGVTVSILPMHHCFEAVMGQMFMLTNGVAIAFGDGLKYVQKNMAEVKPTVMLFVPLLLENLYGKILRTAAEQGKEADLQRRINDYLKLREELGADDDTEARVVAREMFKEEQSVFGGQLDSIFTGAAAINPRVIRGLQEIGIKVTYGYGMTECGPLMHTTPYYSDTLGKIGSVGPATPSGTVRIDKPDKSGIGEVCYKGPTVMLGYYNMPEETAKTIEDGWLHSGDFGFVDDDGWLYITGRKNNIIVTKTGKNVFPEELEAVLNRNSCIAEIMVYSAEDKKRGGALISAQIRPAYEQIAEQYGERYAADRERVFELMRSIVAEYNEGVANYKRIRYIQIRDAEFVKTPTKKIIRSRNL